MGLKISALQNRLLNLIWTPLYIRVASRFFLSHNRKNSFTEQLLSSTRILYIVGDEKEQLDRALSDIDTLKVYNRDLKVLIFAHSSMKCHIDTKLFSDLFFWDEKNSTLSNSGTGILKKVHTLTPQIIVGRVTTLTQRMRQVILKSGASLRIFFGACEFSPFASLLCKDDSVALSTLFPDIKT